MKFNRTFLSTTVAAAALVATALVPAQAQAGDGYVSVYFTRHAEKMTQLTETGDASQAYEAEYSVGEPVVTNSLEVTADGPRQGGAMFDEVCGEKVGDKNKCAEVLNAEGELRAELLADFLARWRVTNRLDAVYSSHKERTRQTVAPTAARAGLSVQQLPADGTELEPEGTSASECPTIDAIRDAAVDSGVDTILVAGHSGTLYDIMGAGNDDCTGLGLDISDDDRFPKKGVKVRDFGDLWKVIVYANGNARFVYRVNLQPKHLFIANKAF